MSEQEIFFNYYNKFFLKKKLLSSMFYLILYANLNQLDKITNQVLSTANFSRYSSVINFDIIYMNIALLIFIIGFFSFRLVSVTIFKEQLLSSPTTSAIFHFQARNRFKRRNQQSAISNPSHPHQFSWQSQIFMYTQNDDDRYQVEGAQRAECDKLITLVRSEIQRTLRHGVQIFS